MDSKDIHNFDIKLVHPSMKKTFYFLVAQLCSKENCIFVRLISKFCRVFIIILDESIIESGDSILFIFEIQMISKIKESKLEGQSCKILIRKRSILYIKGLIIFFLWRKTKKFIHSFYSYQDFLQQVSAIVTLMLPSNPRFYSPSSRLTFSSLILIFYNVLSQNGKNLFI